MIRTRTTLALLGLLLLGFSVQSSDDLGIFSSYGNTCGSLSDCSGAASSVGPASYTRCCAGVGYHTRSSKSSTAWTSSVGIQTCIPCALVRRVAPEANAGTLDYYTDESQLGKYVLFNRSSYPSEDMFNQTCTGTSDPTCQGSNQCCAQISWAMGNGPLMQADMQCIDRSNATWWQVQGVSRSDGVTPSTYWSI